MHDDVRVHDVAEVGDGLRELVGRVVVDEPVLGIGRDVVDDLGHELAVARGVAVEVAARDSGVGVEAHPVLADEGRELRPRERVEPRRGPERLVEHRDPDARAALAGSLQGIRADPRHALRRHHVGGRRVACSGKRRHQERCRPGHQRASKVLPCSGPGIRRER